MCNQLKKRNCISNHKYWKDNSNTSKSHIHIKTQFIIKQLKIAHESNLKNLERHSSRGEGSARYGEQLSVAREARRFARCGEKLSVDRKVGRFARCGEQQGVARQAENQRSLRRAMNSSTGRKPKITKTHLISWFL